MTNKGCWTCKRYYEEQDESGTIYCFCSLYDCGVDEIAGVNPSDAWKSCEGFLVENAVTTNNGIKID